MPDYSALPTTAEVLNDLQAAGIFAIPPTTRQALWDLEAFIDEAADEFSHLTGINPLLPETEDSTRRYNPPGPPYKSKYWSVGGGSLMLLLDPPYRSITSVAVSDDIGAAGDGTVLTANTQYVLEPVNRQDDAEINAVRFRYILTGGRHTVVIVGKVGYWDELPAGVWQAIKSGAIASLLEHLREGIISSPTDWREGESAEKYNVETLLKLGAGHRKRFEDAVAEHKRMLI